MHIHTQTCTCHVLCACTRARARTHTHTHTHTHAHTQTDVNIQPTKQNKTFPCEEQQMKERNQKEKRREMKSTINQMEEREHEKWKRNRKHYFNPEILFEWITEPHVTITVKLSPSSYPPPPPPPSPFTSIQNCSGRHPLPFPINCNLLGIHNQSNRTVNTLWINSLQLENDTKKNLPKLSYKKKK